MRQFPRQSPITMQQRLRRWVGKNVTIRANNLSLEPGKMTRVFPTTFIVVQGERFVPLSLNFIIVHQVAKAKVFTRAGVRTTFDAEGLFDDIQLVKIGKDFIELQREGEARDRYLIPLNKVEGIFKV